jgi:nucleoside-diphosphate-sugar epimerase
VRLIITGAGGLLGRSLADMARQQGHTVIGVGRAASPPIGWSAGDWISMDLAAPAALRHDWAAYAGAAVCHLAADTRIYETDRDFQRDNVVATEAACAIARQTGGRLVFFSSSAVYSGPRTDRPLSLLNEGDEQDPRTGYGRSKRVAEEVVLGSGVDAVILRLFGVLSVRLASAVDRGNLIQAIFRALRGNGVVTLSTDRRGLPAVRDYVLDEDICSWALKTVLTLTPPPDGVRTFNLCTGVGTSTLELVQLASEAARRNLRVEFDPRTTAQSTVMIGDPTALKNWLGHTPPSRVREFWAQVLRDWGQAA